LKYGFNIYFVYIKRFKEYYVVNKLTGKTYFINFYVLRTLNKLYDNFELDFFHFYSV
jgi:hypothetical protein